LFATKIALITGLFALCLTTGCGKNDREEAQDALTAKNACEEARDALKDCGAPDSSTEEEKKAFDTCEADTEKIAKCINDNKQAACAFIKDLSAATSDPNDAFSKCVTSLATE